MRILLNYVQLYFQFGSCVYMDGNQVVITLITIKQVRYNKTAKYFEEKKNRDYKRLHQDNDLNKKRLTW